MQFTANRTFTGDLPGGLRRVSRVIRRLDSCADVRKGRPRKGLHWPEGAHVREGNPPLQIGRSEVSPRLRSLRLSSIALDRRLSNLFPSASGPLGPSLSLSLFMPFASRPSHSRASAHSVDTEEPEIYKHQSYPRHPPPRSATGPGPAYAPSHLLVPACTAPLEVRPTSRAPRVRPLTAA